MPMTYQTCDGDVLDAICATHYGTENLSYIVTQVLEANPGLADRGAVYPSGLFITLPDLAPPVQASAYSLWD
ncbi:tail protein X [Enterobacter hormaechei]|nr:MULTISPECIES: tail protein X [Enterobacter]EKS6338285.1 tail protein X [Enterobacter hormaechei]ELC6342237.1 tail protein X [Enterobacter hormaechei]KTH04066.1 phage tail protein [Enterobacter hormaechei subsp. xiangfangensis]KTI55379.1 phage tail protein [Enterobacter hormaechei subsp. xiangfangensis]KVI88765.1 phage tail protein [Enterobacter hormaechei subsp. xiangfangensis]